MRRKIFLSIVLLTVGVFFTGCTHDMNREEIDEIDLALVLGIDYANGGYELTALYSTGAGADSEAGSGSGKEETIKGKGDTAYEALEDLKLKNKKNITLAQAGSFLVGEGAAENGIDISLDFLKRDETIKMESLIYIIKGGEASAFIKKAIENKQTIHEDLEAVKQKQLKLLTRNDNTLVNLLNDMQQSYSSVLIPYLIPGESSFLIDGYAVFDQLRLKDYLDRETSDGVNFIRNIMRSFPIYLTDDVSLAVSYTNTKLKADVENNLITVTIKVNFETMLKEITTKAGIFNRDELFRLTQEQNNYVRNVLEKPVNYSLQTGLDILNLARLVENQNVGKWSTLEANWTAAIPNIEYQYEVNSQITKSFILGDE